MEDVIARAEQNVDVRWLRMLAMLTLAMAVMISPACKKKKPTPPPPPPTITKPEPEPVPPPETTIPPVTTAPADTANTTTTPAKPKPKRRLARKPAPKPQPPVAAQPATKPSGAVGSSTTPAPSGNGEPMSISPNVPAGDADAQKRDTENLLQTAESNLRRISRPLSDGEQGMARQVRNYITQSRLATQDGDFERAHNLAVKAQLLSGELIK